MQAKKPPTVADVLATAKSSDWHALDPANTLYLEYGDGRVVKVWPNVDPGTGLHLQGDELLIKAREAMTAAVHTFNSAGLYFRAELFIVTAVIA